MCNGVMAYVCKTVWSCTIINIINIPSMWATNIRPIYSISSIYGIPRQAARQRDERVSTTSGSPLDELLTPSDWLFAANEDCATGDWNQRINTDDWLSSVKLYPCCRLLTWLLAAQRLCTSFDVCCRVVPSSNCISYYLKGSVCLAVPFWPIIHWSVGALGSALPSTLDSNHALWNLRTAWQYSPMSYVTLY